MKNKITYDSLTEEERIKVNRFLELSAENQVKVSFSDDQTSILLLDDDGLTIATRPISDFKTS